MKSSKRKRSAKKAGRAPQSAVGASLAEEGPICPHCKTEITWENLESSETEISIYVREKLYFCPKCRAILGIASWHTEG
jgi:uncharacterized protein with PIN domain